MRFALLSLTVAACAVPSSEEPGLGSATSALFTGNAIISRTATVYENQTSFNGGAYSDFCIGNQASTATTRRAFIAYSLPAIPAGATITRVQLTINQLLVRRTGGPLAATLALSRASSWTEGAGGTNTRSCGGGTSSSGVTWNTASSVGVVSATAALSAADGATITIDTDTGTANDGLINDVQAWVNGATNDGWMLGVVEEGTINNARSLTAGALVISWTLANGRTCTQDSDCTTNNCVHTDGLDCGGRAGCVCCSAATCSGVCQTCFRAGVVGTCSPQVAGTPCRNASCTAGIATAAESCNGSSPVCPGPTTQDCSPYTTCAGTVCSSSCQMATDCDPGYFCNGSMVCEAVTDECAQNLDDCVPLATCNDPSTAAGDFTCTCPSGYAGNGRGSGTGCTDIDECMTGTHDCDAHATCTNTPGSFTCACNTGWTGDGHACTDIDECTAGAHDCDAHASCTNTPGTFTCACNAGWTGDGHACTDADECAAGTHDCDIHATCTNASPGFGCTCNAGWTGDGHACTDIDECADGNGGCGKNEVCVNQVGGPSTCEPAGPDDGGGGCCQSNREPSLPTWILIAAVFGLRRRVRRRS